MKKIKIFRKNYLGYCILVLLFGCSSPVPKSSVVETSVWSADKAQKWYAEQEWPVGCNFIPSTAINQLEMWQPQTFDPETIDRELGWAGSLGFNMVRVYLHDLLWQQDSAGFINRVDQFLGICEKYDIQAMFVLFDDCWNGNPRLGPQPDPYPGLHNPYWLQSPAYAHVTDTTFHPKLKSYAQGIVSAFGEDDRVAVWDLYNEPGSNHLTTDITPLVKKVFSWVREVNPQQPITSCIWIRKNWEFAELNNFVLSNSDIISFHHYSDFKDLKREIENFQSYRRPVICTEYLAREHGSKFQTHLPFMKEKKVGAINWGLVFGKTQTVFPWKSKLNDPIPEIWHHDIFWPDGKPYDQEEIDLIISLTNKIEE